MPNSILCCNCDDELSEDEIDLCDDCFQAMPMEEWVKPKWETPKDNNEKGYN